MDVMRPMKLEEVIEKWVEVKSVDGSPVYFNPRNVEYVRTDKDEYIFGLIDGTEFHTLKEL